MNSKLVSVIIPTYNHANFIGYAIESVIAQTYDNWEVIIVNNFSEDDTEEVVKKYEDDRISLVNFRNFGVIGSSRNQGMRLAKGEYIAFLDSDDVWSPRKLEKQIKLLEKDRTLLAVSTNGYEFKQGYKRKVKTLFADKRIKFRELLKSNLIITSSLVMRAENLKTIGFFDEDPRLKAVEDFDYWTRILYAKDNSILRMKEALMEYRLHNANVSSDPVAVSFSLFERCSFVMRKYTDYDKAFVEDAIRNFDVMSRIGVHIMSLYRKDENLSTFFRDASIPFIKKLPFTAKYFIKDLLYKVKLNV